MGNYLSQLLSLMQTANQNKSGDWNTLKRVIRLAIPFKWLFAWTFFLGIAVSIITPIRPYLIQLTVDNNIIKQHGKGLTMMSLLLIGTLLIEFIIKYLFSLYTTQLG